MTLRAGTNRDWKREFISHLLLALAFAFAFEGVCVVVFAALCHSPSQPSSRLIQAMLQRSINFP